jgi:hypothetical protein
MDWISVKDRLPSDKTERFFGGPEGSWGCEVVLRLSAYRFVVAYFDEGDQCFWVNGVKETGTHWCIPSDTTDINAGSANQDDFKSAIGLLTKVRDEQALLIAMLFEAVFIAEDFIAPHYDFNAAPLDKIKTICDQFRHIDRQMTP